MRLTIVNFLLVGLGAAALSTSESQPLNNANHIFNAIHDSMRQFGSSLHHNGMSFFLASVPEGIQLYHGNASPEYLKEIGWMAFEPEHAMVFARPGRSGQRGKSTKEDMVQDADAQQAPLLSEPTESTNDESNEKTSAYLHTYKTANSLRLLYIDGTSAGKSRVGTLDTQGRILFNDTIHGGVIMEDERARSVCHLAENEWEGRLDGVIRMAAGFEIILCKPEVNLLPVRVMPVEKREHEETPARKGNESREQGESKEKRDKKGHRDDKTKGRKHHKKGKKGPKPEHHKEAMNQDQQGPGNGNPRSKPASLLRAITSRFNGIGGERVVLNYNNFVTAYTYDLDLLPSTNSSGTEKGPRLSHISSSDLEPIRRDLTTLVLEHDVNDNKPNWQFVADLIVTKYAPILRGLAPRKNHGKQEDKRHHYNSQKKVKIAEILSPFASASKDETRSLCATQFLSTPNSNSTLSHRALYDISETICSALLNLQNEEDKEVIHASITELMNYLDWSTWKECRGCKDDELCAVPIWPNGSEEDF